VVFEQRHTRVDDRVRGRQIGWTLEAISVLRQVIVAVSMPVIGIDFAPLPLGGD
jgi:hypothetical protein